MKVFTKRAFNAQIKRISAESRTPVPTPSKGTWERLRKKGMSPEAALIKVINAARVPELRVYQYQLQVESMIVGKRNTSWKNSLIKRNTAEHVLGKGKLKKAEKAALKKTGDKKGDLVHIVSGLRLKVFHA